MLAGVIPLIIASIQVIVTDQPSVSFLGIDHPVISKLVIGYYTLLLGLGIAWLVRQLLSIARLRHEKAIAELMLLKSQVNPHFFFNMLNNLYGWVAKDPVKARELILRLSDLMRYTIYDGEKTVVTLKEERDHLLNYIELHKTRYQKHIAITFHDAIDEGKTVMPLLFIMLLENAFKHGVDSLRENAFVDIRLTCKEDAISFVITNNFAPGGQSNKTGIGLQNLQRRLELTYPDKHQLATTVVNNVYKAELILNDV
ncbi:sensor histidine kinase [Paraflavitalea pollutisoli]|uniref:sensor histidine kinase n=1 Tax=Paraflavitalea pollutisoli TaxID=3034143 RepID=UPI0023EB8B84|nr:histidine kinase [Paraflavitalea sp. H1-2-19X]